MKNYEYVLNRNKQFERLSLEDESSLAADEVSVEPVLVGICGSDLYHYSTFQGEQLRLGHEWIGKVTAKGDAVSRVELGDWITTSAALGCGKCEFCLKEKVNLCPHAVFLGSDKIGTLRGSIRMKHFNILKLKSKHESEVLIEVMAVAEEAMRLMRENTQEAPQKILILGAGTVGLLIAELLKEASCPFTIADIKKGRVARAMELNYPARLLPHLLMDENELHSYDIIFDATSDRDGNPGGWNYLPLFGQKNLLAVMIGKYTRKVEIQPDHFSRLAAKMVFMRGVPLDTLKLTIEKWSGKLGHLSEKIISHSFSSKELDEAFKIAMDTSQSGKVVIAME